MNSRTKKDIEQMFSREIAIFEKQAGELPNSQNEEKFKDVRAVWVISGTGSYLSPLINSASDRIYKAYPWYAGQDKARLDYALRWLKAFAKKSTKDCPILIYNGTEKQNADLLEAIRQKKFKFPKSRLYIAPGKISKTLEQVKKFSFPPALRQKKFKLAVLSHSAHLPRILRFINEFPKPFANVEVVPLSINVSDPEGQNRMADLEKKNLLRYIAKGEASINPYPFIQSENQQNKDKQAIKISSVKKNDLMDIFKLSNQDSVRAVSFNSTKIKLKDHQKWFAQKLKDKDTIMFKALLDGKFAGQTRLEIKNETALIGVSVDEKFRGKGIASALLRAAVLAAKKRKIKVIEAFIKPDNLPSIGLFEKNGWIFAGRGKQSGQIANKYVRKI